MKVELNQADLVNLVKGTSPYYSEFENPLVKRAGGYMSGGHGEQWHWGSTNEMKELSEDELWELYNICKNSWS